jgi:hypothetical protein
MLSRSKRVVQSTHNGQTTDVLPATDLFPGSAAGMHADVLMEVPTKRAVWRIVLTAVAGTVILLGLVAGGYVVYHDKTTEISHLRGQRESLRAANTVLGARLATTNGKLAKANLKLTNATKGLSRAKKNLTKLGKNLAAANARADANYSSGYSAGSNAGYSTGVSAGLVRGSDQLSCSDDSDVYWLPACNW